MASGLIRNRELVRQIKSFAGLRFGTITPTDIDFALEYHDLLFIFGELKYQGTAVARGQRVFLERVVTRLSDREDAAAFAFVADHMCDPSTDIPVADCLIREVYTATQGWVRQVEPYTVADFVVDQINKIRMWKPVMKPAVNIVQSTFDFAMREINALETRIVKSEDDADSMLWEQAGKVVEQLDAPGMTQRKLAVQWINVRTGAPYSHRHVGYTAQAFGKFTSRYSRPRFRDAYNEIANAADPKMRVHHSSESVEHYTPPDIVRRVVVCLQAIDLDPCSSDPPTIPATRHFIQDGLDQPWSGRVYMNPPYGKEIDAWVQKLCESVESGDVLEAIALVPARPDTQWFHRMRNYVCCFIEGRLTFVGNDDPAPFPSAVFYLGEDLGAFYHAFADAGDIWQRIEPGMFGE